MKNHKKSWLRVRRSAGPKYFAPSELRLCFSSHLAGSAECAGCWGRFRACHSATDRIQSSTTITSTLHSTNHISDTSKTARQYREVSPPPWTRRLARGRALVVTHHEGHRLVEGSPPRSKLCCTLRRRHFLALCRVCKTLHKK